MYVEIPVSEIAIRTTAVVAVLSYVARVLCDLIAQHNTLWNRRARVAWTLGCLFLLLHIALGFHFVHGWSHSHAWSHTAARTAAVTGWSWGGGLYINHTFAVLWLTDTLAWWRLGITFVYRRSWYYWSIAIVFAFIMINATLVFGPRYWMLGNLCAVAAIAFLLVRRNRANSTSQSQAIICCLWEKVEEKTGRPRKRRSAEFLGILLGQPSCRFPYPKLFWPVSGRGSESRSR